MTNAHPIACLMARVPAFVFKSSLVRVSGYWDFDLDSKHFLSKANGLCDVAR